MSLEWYEWNLPCHFVVLFIQHVRLEKCSALQVMFSEELKPWQLDMADINNAD